LAGSFLRTCSDAIRTDWEFYYQSDSIDLFLHVFAVLSISYCHNIFKNENIKVSTLLYSTGKVISYTDINYNVNRENKQIFKYLFININIVIVNKCLFLLPVIISTAACFIIKIISCITALYLEKSVRSSGNNI